MDNSIQKKAKYINDEQTKQDIETYRKLKKELQDLGVKQKSDQNEIYRHLGDNNVILSENYIVQKGLPARFFNYQKMAEDYPELYKEYYGITNKPFIRIVDVLGNSNNYFDKL